MEPKITPDQYFRSLEPDETKRADILKIVKLMLTPRTGYPSIVIIKGPTDSGKSLFVEMLRKIMRHQTLSIRTHIKINDERDRPTGIRDFINTKILIIHTQDKNDRNLVFKRIEELSGNDSFNIYNTQSKKYESAQPKFRFVLIDEESEDIIIPEKLKKRVITIELTQTFNREVNNPNRLKLDDIMTIESQEWLEYFDNT